MYQVVIYLKKTNSVLVQQDTFQLTQLSHRFNVIRLWEEPTETFLKISGLLPFAILSQTDNPIDVLTQVSQRIEQITDRKMQSHVAASTAILAGLSLNQNDIRRILRSEIMKESVIYQEILAEGRQEGQQEATEKIALNLLHSGMRLEEVAKLTDLTIEQVQILRSRRASLENS